MNISSHLLNQARICEPERGYLSEVGLRHSKYGKMSCISNFRIQFGEALCQDGGEEGRGVCEAEL